MSIENKFWSWYEVSEKINLWNKTDDELSELWLNLVSRVPMENCFSVSSGDYLYL